MTTAIKRRRGTTVQHSTFTGLEGELTVDTTKKTVVVHDGSTAGGTPLAKESQATTNVNITGGSISGITDLAVADGGTGASTASDARSNLGLGTMATQNSNNVSISGGIVIADIVYGKNTNSVGSFTWDTATQSPEASISVGSPIVTSIHSNVRRCLLKDDGTVNYYLSATDSTKKEDGTAANLSGSDGMVMVEVPMFYTKRSVIGTEITWSISQFPLDGYNLHPAFIKDGAVVPFRYYSAYDACVFDASAAAYISGTNLDNNTANIDTNADMLASVAGVYPMVGLTRNQFRLLAAKRGAGWRQLDFTLWSALQILFLIEHQSFFTQNILGAGNTNGSYLASSSDQNQSPHTIAGASNSLGNSSTDTTTGAGVNAKPGTSFMSYRGVENWYGNCWNWADGINVNVGTNGNVHVTNNRADFADNTSTNMTLVSTTAPTTSGFVSAIAAIDYYFLASSVSGGSSTTYLTDQWFGSASSNRVVLVGGGAGNAAAAGGFFVFANFVSSDAARNVGARLAY
jgi:hypothetical protein